MPELFISGEMADTLPIEDLVQPFVDIHELFCYYNDLYFHGALGACSVSWSSKRMTLCAGVCHCMKMGGCEIRLSEPLLRFRSTADIKNTLLHEMIHAFLFLTNGYKDHDDHGPSFQELMKKINEGNGLDYQRPANGYNITIYHSFIDEVNNYKAHHWKCPNCGDMIKRSMNRKPSPSDCRLRVVATNEFCNDSRCHWHHHQRHCGGNYVKIAEPAGYQDKRRNTKSDGKSKNSNAMKKSNKSIEDIKKDMSADTSSHHVISLEETFYPTLRKERGNSTSKNSLRTLMDDNNTEGWEEMASFKRRRKNPAAEIIRPPVASSVRVKANKMLEKDNLFPNCSNSCSHETAYDVIIKWKDWYAFENDEFLLEPLSNKRQERRKHEKMLNHVGKAQENKTVHLLNSTKYGPGDDGQSCKSEICKGTCSMFGVCDKTGFHETFQHVSSSSHLHGPISIEQIDASVTVDTRDCEHAKNSFCIASCNQAICPSLKRC